jgi:hypothetical protein
MRRPWPTVGSGAMEKKELKAEPWGNKMERLISKCELISHRLMGYVM